MRIITYNILHGGQGRADPLAEIISAQHPDVVCLVEADEPDVLQRIANRLDMDCIVAQGSSRHPVALLSRWPIVETINHGALGCRPGAVLQAALRGPAGSEWLVALVHLHPHAADADEIIREGEVAALLDILQPHRAACRPHILAGDFNANSPIQQIDPARCKPETRREWEQNGSRIPRRAIQNLLDAGYVDSLHAVLGDAACTAATFTTQFPAQRIDYIFTYATDPQRFRAAWIEDDRLAKYASDHYPVGLEIADTP